MCVSTISAYEKHNCLYKLWPQQTFILLGTSSKANRSIRSIGLFLCTQERSRNRSGFRFWSFSVEFVVHMVSATGLNWMLHLSFVVIVQLSVLFGLLALVKASSDRVALPACFLISCMMKLEESPQNFVTATVVSTAVGSLTCAGL